MDKKMMVSGVLLTIVMIGQILSAVLLYDPQANALRINVGWGVMMLSALFGWLPIFTFRKKGEVECKGYIHTTVLVNSGVYRIVRHPQYLAGILINIALTLITLHWLVAILGLIAILILYRNTYEEEKGCVEKFGDQYKAYRQTVPRLNFLLGIWRMIEHKFR